MGNPEQLLCLSLKHVFSDGYARVRNKFCLDRIFFDDVAGGGGKVGGGAV